MPPIRRNLYRGTDYALWYSTAAGFTNAITEYSKGYEFNPAFGNGFVNNIKMGIWMSMLYPPIIDQLKKTKHPRLYVNIFHITMVAALTFWHMYEGTENPIISMIPSAIVGSVKVNSEDLESKIDVAA